MMIINDNNNKELIVMFPIRDSDQFRICFKKASLVTNLDPPLKLKRNCKPYFCKIYIYKKKSATLSEISRFSLT